jgi:hypothetical protein
MWWWTEWKFKFILYFEIEFRNHRTIKGMQNVGFNVQPSAQLFPTLHVSSHLSQASQSLSSASVVGLRGSVTWVCRIAAL